MTVRLNHRLKSVLAAKQKSLALTCKLFLPLLVARRELVLWGEAGALSVKVQSLNRFLTTTPDGVSRLTIRPQVGLSPPLVLPAPLYG